MYKTTLQKHQNIYNPTKHNPLKSKILEPHFTSVHASFTSAISRDKNKVRNKVPPQNTYAANRKEISRKIYDTELRRDRGDTTE